MFTIEECYQIKENANNNWIDGVNKLFDKQGKEHRKRMIELMGVRDPNKVYLSPSKASVFTNNSGVVTLEGMCHRSIFFSRLRMAETNPTPPFRKRKMMIGNLVEEAEHNIEYLTGLQHSCNEIISYTIDDQTDIIGEYDSMLIDNHGRQYIKEIKAIYGYDATRKLIKGTKKIIPQPRWGNAIQIMLYIAMMGLQYGILKYIDATSMINERNYVVELENIEKAGNIVDKVLVIDGYKVEDIRMSTIMQRFMALANYIREKTVPPRECSVEYSDSLVEAMYRSNIITKGKYEKHMTGKNVLGDWQCRLCNYRDLCHMSDKDLARHVKTRIDEIEKSKKEQEEINIVSGDVIVW